MGQCFSFTLICAFWKLIKITFSDVIRECFQCKIREGGPHFSAISVSAGFQKICFVILSAAPTMTEYNFFSKICLLNKERLCSRHICYTWELLFPLLVKRNKFGMGEFSNWYGWHYAGSLQGLFWMQSIDPVTIALGAWQPFMGRAEGLFRQDCCINTMKSEQCGGTKPLGALLLETFWMMGFLQIFCFTPLFFVWPSPSNVQVSES